MKAIIFGINGQDGFYLKSLLLKNNLQVTGVSRGEGDWIKGSVSDLTFVESLIKEIKPDFIFHLAANSSTSHQLLFENHETITTGTWNILESVKKHNPSAHVFISGSGLQFVNQGKPICETDSFDPSSVYSVSRINSVYIARYYRKLGLNVYIGYFFNHDSPRRSNKHVNQKIVSFAKKISRGENLKLKIGNIETQKEFNFAGDIVNAIWLLVNSKIHEAVIGSGKAYSIKEWLALCFNKFGLSWQDYVEQDPGFISEYEILVSDPKIILSLGWEPQINFEALAEMMINQNNE